MNKIPTVIKKIYKNTDIRKKRKKEINELINLSHTRVELNTEQIEDGYFRLLSDGAMDIDFSEDDDIRFWLKKGTCKQIYDNILDAFVGELNEGHSSFIENLVQLGIWQKSDLQYGVDENGYGYLNFKPQLNTKLSRVKDIIIQRYPLGFSAELNLAYNEEDSKEHGFLVFDDGELTGIAVVGASGDPTAGNIFLDTLAKEQMKQLQSDNMLAYFKEVNDMGEKVTIKNILAKLNIVDEEEKPDTEQKQEIEQKPKEPVKEQSTEEFMKETTELIQAVDSLVEEIKKLKEEVKAISEANEVLEAENKEVKATNEQLKTVAEEKEESLHAVEALAKKLETLNLDVKLGKPEEIDEKHKNVTLKVDGFGIVEE